MLHHPKHNLDMLGNVLAGRIGHLPINNEGIASEGKSHCLVSFLLQDNTKRRYIPSVTTKKAGLP
jgi:hypothetical protein